MSELPCPYCGFNCEVPSNVEEKIECPSCRSIFLYIQNSESHGTIDYRPPPEINDGGIQMSELKAYIAPTPDGTGLADYYLKSEADKVIAELEDCIRDYSENEENLVIVNLDMQRRERHHKHKRCLNKAEWCDTKADWYYGFGESFRDRVKFYMKWRDKWLELAEKFKDR
jgi:hypothetical protein